MLNIVIDSTPINSQKTGVGFFVYALIHELATIQQKQDFDLTLLHKNSLKSYLTLQLNQAVLPCLNVNVQYSPLPVKISNLVLDINAQYLSQEIKNLHKHSCTNIYHGTNYTTFPYLGFKKVISIYDMTFARHPAFINRILTYYPDYIKRIKKCLQWTDLIITISESSKQDIVNFLGVDPEKIQIAYLASRFSAQQKLPKKEKPAFRGNPFLLFVGTLEPRKNIPSIIQAFEHLKKTVDIPHDLIIVGRKGWQYQPILRKITSSPFYKSIHHLNYVNDDQLASLYQQADALVYPSWYEGFGLPILEAMGFGTPVITSNTSSMPEVAGDAALFVDPAEPLDLASAILHLLQDDTLRKSLISKGIQRNKEFSWRSTAHQVLDAYASLC